MGTLVDAVALGYLGFSAGECLTGDVSPAC
jgi:hypothetical protein